MVMASKRIDRSALTELIRSLDGINNDQRADLLQLLNDRKRYGLVWEEHSEDVEEQLRENLPVLKEVCERRILSDDAESPNHILIEGDNLHALIALTYTHEGKVDVIYIDPPYNTGNKDFIYNDSFVDAEDGFRHSKWLSFMKKRLHIAKRLLSDRGVIFISIDDNEQANLKLLCDEVFGEINGIGPIIQNKLNAKNDTVNIQKNHEYILCYRKNLILDGTRVLPNILINKEIDKEVQKEGELYFYLNDSITTRGEGGVLKARPKLGYTFYYNPQTKDLIPQVDYDFDKAKTSNIVDEVYTNNLDLLSKGYVAIRPPMVRGKLGCWTWDINKAKKDIHELFVKGTKNRYNVVKRTLVSPVNIEERGGRYYFVKKEESNSKSIIDFSTNDGSKVLSSILGSETIFNNPKNLEMIKYFISATVDSNIILDFFAGSGTTLHATMQLNEEDGGKRQCILVTNNENEICEKVTYERNKRVIEGYTTPKGENVEGLKNNNLRYYKIDFVDRDSSVTAMKKLMVASTDLLCIKQDLYEEKDTFGSITLKPNIARYFNDGVKQMLIIYNTDAIESLVAEIEKMPEDTNIITYVFSTNNYPLNADFEDVADKVSLCALPAAINNAYRNVLPNKLTPKSDDHETETISGE